MDRHRNQSFSTFDRDNDLFSSDNCATNRHGAWWFHGESGNCRATGLNALYNAGSTNIKNIYWQNLPGDQYHIKYTEMKIRPLPDSQ
ncbi:Fibrinogen C domain-containing protein 1-B [Holothuria leucospilota]|uniref:Fibrinogen C domain-containing protein 1-B n=1 Tax=Holothuria leucospilota TaxID=206669 RepID=A0A9Q0YI82_HOLLE|nr:Fibrinogen C domain-containing protein 1-B [Holothuria leucospilota]